MTTAKLPPCWRDYDGGWDADSHRVANFVAVFASLAAVGLWSATGLAVARRVEGSDLPLREFRKVERFLTAMTPRTQRSFNAKESDKT